MNLNDIQLGPYQNAKGDIINLHIKDGLISKIEKNPQAANQKEPLAIIFPGLVDMHVHFRQPGHEHKETIKSGLNSAISGGVTTCGDMPNNDPVTDNFQAIQRKVGFAGDLAPMIFFHIAAGKKNFSDIEAAASSGVTRGIKLYMGETTGASGLPEKEAPAFFEIASDLALVLLVHAEKNSIIDKNRNKFPSSLEYHSDIRSVDAERAAVCDALDLAAKYNTTLYICHVTCAAVFEEIVSAKKSGVRCFIEVTPHHLYLDRSFLKKPMKNLPCSIYQVNPPLRDAEDADFLKSKLQRASDGYDQVDVIGSDHAPHLLTEKRQKYPLSPSGIPGVDLMLPLAANLHHQGYMDLERLEELVCASAAKIFSLENRGAIEVGKRADLVVWDRGEQRIVDKESIKSKCGWSPYEGMKLIGWPSQVYLFGEKINIKNLS